MVSNVSKMKDSKTKLFGAKNSNPSSLSKKNSLQSQSVSNNNPTGIYPDNHVVLKQGLSRKTSN